MPETNQQDPRQTILPWATVATLVAVGAVVVTALVVILHIVTVAEWNGRKTLPVTVYVIDADTMKPLVGVPVSVFNSSIDALEGPTPDPGAASAELEKLVTTANGCVTCDRRFWAGGGGDLFTHSGCVVLGGVWIEVALAGYGAVLLPVDGQWAMRTRDVKDGSPLIVTVLLRRDKGLGSPVSKSP